MRKNALQKNGEITMVQKEYSYMKGGCMRGFYFFVAASMVLSLHSMESEEINVDEGDKDLSLLIALQNGYMTVMGGCVQYAHYKNNHKLAMSFADVVKTMKTERISQEGYSSAKYDAQVNYDFELEAQAEVLREFTKFIENEDLSKLENELKGQKDQKKILKGIKEIIKNRKKWYESFKKGKAKTIEEARLRPFYTDQLPASIQKDKKSKKDKEEQLP